MAHPPPDEVPRLPVPLDPGTPLLQPEVLAPVARPLVRLEQHLDAMEGSMARMANSMARMAHTQGRMLGTLERIATILDERLPGPPGQTTP